MCGKRYISGHVMKEKDLLKIVSEFDKGKNSVELSTGEIVTLTKSHICGEYSINLKDTFGIADFIGLTTEDYLVRYNT